MSVQTSLYHRHGLWARTLKPSEVCSGREKSGTLGEGSQGGVCYYKNSEAIARATGNLRRAGWTQGQGKP